MINISNCPITGLKRKVVNKDFLWFEGSKQIIIDCHIKHFKTVDNVDVLVENARIKSYSRKLVASNSWVDAQTGRVWTEQECDTYKATLKAIADYPVKQAQYEIDAVRYNELVVLHQQQPEMYPEPVAPIAPILPATPQAPMEEYDFYTTVLGVTPIILPNLIVSIIGARDLDGKFDI